MEYGDRVNGSSGFAGVAGTGSDVLIAGAPSAPTDVSGTRGDGSAVVSFTAPATGGSPITGYTVTASPGDAATSCSASPCTVTGLTNGTSYTFTVTATNTYGTGPASSASSAVTPGGPPAAPTSFTVARGNGSETLQFTPPGDNGSTITGYQYSLDGGLTWHSFATTTSGSTLSGVIHGLANGRTYSVTVRAVNATGPGAASAPASVTPHSAPVPRWALDPLTPAQRHRLAKIRAHPLSTHGKLRHTRAIYRTHNGTLAVPAGNARGHELARGQAAQLTGLFGFDSAKLTTAGRHAVLVFARSLRDARTITCEGYADYAGGLSHESTLSRQRAAIVCTVLRRNAGLQAPCRGVWPAAPGRHRRHPQSRIDNRRVAILVTR